MLQIGSGFVEKVGEGVEVAQPGDPVLLSFAACRKCQICKAGHESHCVELNELNFSGNKCFYSQNSQDLEIRGSFFGQSSFANLTIAHESSVVNVKGLVKSEEELKLFAPLGCGIQTGSGTIINVANAKAHDTVAIMGVGGVGLSGIMAAKMVGCKTIIAIDRVSSRLALAKELGATHTIDTSELSHLDELVQKVRDLTDGYGTSITMDATGFLKLIQKGIEFTARRGQYIQVGSTPRGAVLEIPLQQMMISGKRLIFAVEGQVIPQQYIPKMIKWNREGRLPFDRLSKFFPAEQFMEAIHGMEDGTTIKPIIVW